MKWALMYNKLSNIFFFSSGTLMFCTLDLACILHRFGMFWGCVGLFFSLLLSNWLFVIARNTFYWLVHFTTYVEFLSVSKTLYMQKFLSVTLQRSKRATTSAYKSHTPFKQILYLCFQVLRRWCVHTENRFVSYHS